METSDDRRRENVGWGVAGAAAGLFVGILAGASASAPPTGDARDWLRGGTLHDADLAEWSRASGGNQLATAADFAWNQYEDQLSLLVGSTNTDMVDAGFSMLRGLSTRLVDCVNGVEDGTVPSDMLVREMIPLCQLVMEALNRGGDESTDIDEAAAGAFGDGTHLVGTDVQPGTYRAEAGLDGCYWERLSGLGGDIDDVIANQNVDGSAIVTIGWSDRAFLSQGCGRWRRVEE